MTKYKIIPSEGLPADGFYVVAVDETGFERAIDFRHHTRADAETAILLLQQDGDA